MPLEDRRMGRARHKTSTSARLKAGHKRRAGRDANRTRQKERQEWHAGKEVGSRKDGRVGRTECLTARVSAAGTQSADIGSGGQQASASGGLQPDGNRLSVNTWWITSLCLS